MRTQGLTEVGQGAQSGRKIFKPSSQICSSVKSRKSTSFMQPQNATTVVSTGSATGALNANSNTFTDFLLDSTLGFVDEIQCRVQLTFTDSAHLPAIVPTTHFLQRMEVYTPDGTLAETVYPEQLYLEAVAHIPDQDRTLVANSYNINPDGSQRNLYVNVPSAESGGANSYSDWLANNATQPAAAATPNAVYVSPSNFLYIPLTNCCLSAGVFLAGYSGSWKLRLYWASNIISQLQVGGAGPYTAFPQQVSITQPTLIVEESVVDQATFAESLRAHREGVVDQDVIFRERMQIINQSAFTLNNPISFYLTGFRNKSAGVELWFQPPTPANDRLLQKLQFAQFEWLDQRGNRQWFQLLDTDYNGSRMWRDALESTFPQSANSDIASVSISSFSTDLAESLKKGCANGSVAFSGQDQIRINPAITAPPANQNPAPLVNFANPMLYMTCFSRGHIACVSGKAVVRWD